MYQQQQKLQATKLQKQMSTGGTPPLSGLTIDQVNAQADALEAAQTQAFTDASKYIADLKTQVAAGGPVTQAQLDTLGNHLAALTATTTAFDINNTEPVIPIPPIQPVVPAS
jgi:hypothetical protein